MARPKLQPGEQSVLERIEAAFWELLAQESYAKISIRKLAAKAKVNHNTIYYYYQNIDEMAIAFFHCNISDELLQQLMRMFLTDDAQMDIVLTEELYFKYRRGCLFLRGESNFLINIFKVSLRDAWLNLVGRSYAELEPKDKIMVDFIFSGLIAVIANPLMLETPALLPAILHTEIGQGLVAVFKRLAK